MPDDEPRDDSDNKKIIANCLVLVAGVITLWLLVAFVLLLVKWVLL